MDTKKPEKDRIPLRASKGTPKGDKRRELLEEIRLAALSEGRQYELLSTDLVWWGLERAMWGYRLVKEQQKKEALLKQMSGSLK